jgi:hypothetical protein
LLTFWGRSDSSDPNENAKGVVSHADGSEEESQEEGPCEEEGQEGEEEEIVRRRLRSTLSSRTAMADVVASVGGEGKGRGPDVRIRPRPEPKELERAALRRGFFLRALSVYGPISPKVLTVH